MTRRRTDPDFIPTGFAAIDYGGSMLRRGRLTVLGGRPCMGKTGLALNLASRLLSQGLKVCYVTTQLSPDNLTERLGTVCADADLSGLSVNGTLSVLSGLHEWESVIRDEAPGADVVIFDMVDDAASFPVEIIEEFGNTAFLALLPVSGRVEEGDEHHPGMWDITGLAELKKHVYCAATIYREDYYAGSYSYEGVSRHHLMIFFHVWDTEPSFAVLDVGKGFILSDYRDGFRMERDFTDDRRGIYRFIGSPDYREFFSAVGYEFTPLEKAWLAWRCRDVPETERIAAIREYASEDPDFVIGKRPLFPEEMTLGDFAIEYTDDAERRRIIPEGREWIRDGFSALWLDFPVPFARGDLLTATDPHDENIYLYAGDSVMDEKTYSRLEAEGDGGDMCVTVWTYDPDMGFLHNLVMPLELETYHGCIEEENPVLGLVADHLKGRTALMPTLGRIFDAVMFT